MKGESREPERTGPSFGAAFVPIQNLIDNALPTRGERVEYAIETRGVKEGKGKEGKGREAPLK
jgi:hypothetical protein